MIEISDSDSREKYVNKKFKNSTEIEKYIDIQVKKIHQLIKKRKYGLAQKIINDARVYFPYDVQLLKLQITLLIISKDFETAMEYVNMSRKENFTRLLADIYCFTEDYDGLKYLYDNYYSNPDCFERVGNKDTFELQKYYIMGILGIEPKINILDCPVKLQQVYNYNEEVLLSYIEMNMIKKSDDNNRSCYHYYFNEDIDIRKIYNEIKVILKDNLNKGTYYNSEVRYSVYYPGISDNKKAKYITISCMCGSSNIISFYPDDKCFDLISSKEELLIEGDKKLIKSPTGLKRFNKRYNL